MDSGMVRSDGEDGRGEGRERDRATTDDGATDVTINQQRRNKVMV